MTLKPQVGNEHHRNINYPLFRSKAKNQIGAIKSKTTLYEERMETVGTKASSWRVISGRILFAHPDARAMFLHNDLLCNGTCSVTGGGAHNVLGGTNGKDPI